MSGPARIVELDNVPVEKWKVDLKAVYLWKGKLWKKEKVGCAICVEKEGPQFTTFCHTEDDSGAEFFHCMEHGTLVALPYSMKKVFTIKIGDVFRDGEELLEDVILFPANMPVDERNKLIGEMLDEAEKDEHEQGAAPPVED